MSQPNNQVNVDIAYGHPNDEHPAPNLNTTTPDVINRSNAIGRNTAFSDRLNNVFREIRPLVEQARMGNNARLSLPTWMPRSSTHALDIVPANSNNVTHVNMGPNAQSYSTPDGVRRASNFQLTSETVIAPELSPHAENIGITIEPSNPSSLPEVEDSTNDTDELNQQALDLCACINLMIQYAPFYLILILKFMYDCREGLFTFVILWFTFYHGNLLVKRECGKQSSRSITALLFELIFTLGSVFLVHFLFGHDRLLQNVVMFPGYTEPIDVWELIWLVCITDLIVKIFTVDLKILITATPPVVLPYQKRGKVYLFIESVSQLYRSLLPIQPWLFYLMQSYSGSEKMTGMFLATVYVICKVVELFVRLRLFKIATSTLLQSVNLGTKPTGDQMRSAGENCPICHDDFSTPVRLGCGHIFCELCITAWLDREHTCPLCRAKVSDEPTWRDGSTTHYFQLY